MPRSFIFVSFLCVARDTVAALFCLANLMSFESFKCLVTTCGLNYLFTVTDYRDLFRTLLNILQSLNVFAETSILDV